MELYKRYRPKSLKRFVGNKNVVSSLQGKIKNDSIPHAILFTGPTGSGKTTLGRILANVLECKGLDYKELDSGIFRGIDTIRDLRKDIFFKPLESPFKVILIDEVHQLGTGGSSMKNPAQNALLKILEDTPEHVYIILCTTDPQMLIKPIKGRCTQYNLEPLNEEDMEKLLKRVIKKEKKEVPKEVIEQITLDSQGLCRNALQILERVIDLDEDQMLEAAKENAEKTNAVIELSRALLKGENWTTVSKILKGLKGEDPEGIRRQVLGYMQSVLLGNPKNNIPYIVMEGFEEPMYDIGFPGVVLNCYRIIHGTE